MTPTKLLLYAKGKKIDRQNRDAEMYNWFLVYAIPAISCGIGAAFNKDVHNKLFYQKKQKKVKKIHMIRSYS